MYGTETLYVISETQVALMTIFTNDLSLTLTFYDKVKFALWGLYYENT